MRRYDVTVRLSPLYGREGAGTRANYGDIEGGSFQAAAQRAVARFVKENKIPNRVGRKVTVELIRVL